MNKVKCIQTIKFKNGLNYFSEYTYNFTIEKNNVSVSYEDGRFTTMSIEIFENHFSVIDKK